MEPDPPVSARPAIWRFHRKLQGKVALWLPGAYFLPHFWRAKKWSPGGSVRLARVTWGVSPGGSGHQNGRFVEAKRTFFKKAALATDRLVALPGRSNLTPRLRGQVNLRGAGGGSKSVTVPYGIVAFEAEKKGSDGQVNRPVCENERFASTKWSVCRRV